MRAYKSLIRLLHKVIFSLKRHYSHLWKYAFFTLFLLVDGQNYNERFKYFF